MASDRSVPRRAGEIRHRRAGALESVLHRLRQRRRLDDERLRPHVEADFRRPADRIDRRHRRCAVRSQCDLRRQRRRHRAARPLHRRRHLQIDRRGEDMDAPRPSRRPADSVHRRRPARRQSPVRCGAGPSVRAERRARRLPIDRRRTNVSESVLQGREHRRVGPRARSAESRRRLRVSVGDASGSVGERRLERHQRRHLQIDRRRHDVASADTRSAGGRRAGRRRDRAERAAPHLRVGRVAAGGRHLSL